MIEKFQIKDLNIACVRNETSTRVVYMIYPFVNGFEDNWLENQSQKNNCSLVVVYVPLDKWNDYLTPWPEPGETKDAEAFAGDGREFLKILQEEVIPQAEKTLGIEAIAERDLVGVSLSGLFTLWEWLQCETFRSIACLSGSFWYEGFMNWFNAQSIPDKKGKAFFLLGTEEPKAHIKAYRTVGINTEAVVETLKKSGIDVTFKWVPGNHFVNPLPRAEAALKALCHTSN